MLKELFERLDKKRDIQIDSTDYGVYSERPQKMIYSDCKQEYASIERYSRKLEVSSVNSFIDFISEELKRLNNETGNKTTVTINTNGGYFSADDDFKQIGCNYKRSLTNG